MLQQITSDRRSLDARYDMARYNIGIDTGGTYTDAVIVELHDRKVVASAKALTTRGDLSIGVTEALGKILGEVGAGFDRDGISLVSLSTTLATNALVENRGSSIAAILIGFKDAMAERTGIAQAIPSARIIRVAGGHTHNGEEREALDEAAIRSALNELRDSVDAYSVAGHFSVRNPGHENRARQLIRESTGCPVTASCDLSDDLDGPRRALTASLNARIVSLIVDLIAAVRLSLAREGISAPLMIVKGDGSIATAEAVSERPIETILSGPAASVIGAKFLSGYSDFIISDIGGTTTDVAIVKEGWPSLCEHGSVVGGYRTLVHAIDMQTTGLGGDSEVEIDFDGRVTIKANRVVPISLMGSRWPAMLETLRSSLASGVGLRRASQYLVRPEGSSQERLLGDLSAFDLELLQRVEKEPKPYSDLAFRVGEKAAVARLVDRGLVQIVGFTPSDAAHVLGLQSQWSHEAAVLACLIIGRASGSISNNDKQAEAEAHALAQSVFDAVVAKSAHLMVEKLSGQHFDVSAPLVAAATAGLSHVGDLGIALKSRIPVVAVGGPAAVFYPDVGKRLGVETIIPEESAVANAIGAAIGMVKIRVIVEITKREDGAFSIHHEGEPVVVYYPREALEQATAIAEETARRHSTEMGGRDFHVDVQIHRINLPDRDGDQALVAATVTAECTGAPQIDPS
jgi:N-methylhydantoinase A/oxoprolinase/acetone carboxylase beta subunit